ncbi:hypothetical protein BN11_1880014 [Nostocoides australiense Ben110]|uniref:Uncharacterized protein n=1 Tax=Nostocoides australiense Ben110 TaxID=1193182 RepID=W6JVS7_9MICO|nr:hypothetical protein BN11_1880014 [Tetrasphaera australiensis Ben110]
MENDFGSAAELRDSEGERGCDLMFGRRCLTRTPRSFVDFEVVRAKVPSLSQVLSCRTRIGNGFGSIN